MKQGRKKATKLVTEQISQRRKPERAEGENLYFNAAASKSEGILSKTKRLPHEILFGSEVIAMIRKAGGDVWLGENGRLMTKGVSGDLLLRLEESEYLVRAILREEIATLRWESSGHDPDWWRFPEWRWLPPDQTLRPADKSVFDRWLRERCAVDRRCCTAAAVLFQAFCREHDQDVSFLQFLEASGFPENEGFIDGPNARC
jgi:hypothetical protein